MNPFPFSPPAARSARAAVSSKRRRRALGAATVLTISALVLAACGGVSPKIKGASTTTVPPSSTTTTKPKAPPSTAQAALFFGRGNALGVSYRTEPASSVRYDTMRALFAGPSTAEKAAGLGTAIPSGSIIEGLSFNGSLAYVDVNGQFFAASTKSVFTLRLAQVVYTLTEFAGVDRVQLYLHGLTLPRILGIPTTGPLTRSDLTGAINDFLIVSPAVNESTSSPITVSGISEFTGALEIQLTDSSGQLIVNTVNTTTVGETFTYTYPYTSNHFGSATLQVYAAPDRSSTSQLVASIPVRLTG